jgi:hypothetical protein
LEKNPAQNQKLKKVKVHQKKETRPKRGHEAVDREKRVHVPRHRGRRPRCVHR